MRAILIWRRERPIPGCDQVSQAPSGEKARSRTGPLIEVISSVTSPPSDSVGEVPSGSVREVSSDSVGEVSSDSGSEVVLSDSVREASSGSGPDVDVSPDSSVASRISRRPSFEAIARRSPCGSETISSTRPSSPEARRRGSRWPEARGRKAISTASSPSASVT